jgi:ferredoxin-NADP reductase
MVATRLRDSAFKRELTKMPVGALVTMAGPSGDLTLDRNANRPAVLVAGGIGITPFRSMVFHAANEELLQHIFLFYSSRLPEDAPFLDELQALEKTNPNYKLIASMTEMEQSHRPWHGETGLIDEAMLAKHLKGLVSPVYYIAGPPAMVQALHTMIRKTGIADVDIRAEEFAGY